MNTHLVGFFMDDQIYNSYKIQELIANEGASENKIKNFEAKDKITCAAIAENFEKACQQSGLEYTFHHDHNIVIEDLKHESIDADLLIIDSKEALTHYTKKLPTRFICVYQVMHMPVADSASEI